MERSNVTKATLGRLPQYLQFLNGLPPGQYDHISATTIAKMLSLGEVQVRKDLAAVSGLGKPKVGYRTSELIKDLEDALGCKKLTPAILVGAGIRALTFRIITSPVLIPGSTSAVMMHPSFL